MPVSTPPHSYTTKVFEPRLSICDLIPKTTERISVQLYRHRRKFERN